MIDTVTKEKRKALSCFFIFSFLIFTSSCPSPTDGGGSVTGVSLNKTTATLDLVVSSSETLVATVSPSNATNKAVTWSSSDTDVATVSNGIVTAVAVGNAAITVATEDGNKTAACNVTVIADPNVGMNGTADKPYKVYNPETLSRIGTTSDWNLTAHYLQIADITLTASNWTPIGNATTSFSGTYDGGGHTISTLTINASTSNNQGMFGVIGNGTVKNLGLVYISISAGGRTNVGGIAGQKIGGTVSNCFVSGTVSGAYSVGGVVGSNNSNTVSYCYAAGSVSASGGTVGGVAGYNQATVSNCYSTASVTGSGTGSNINDGRVGGVVGDNQSGATVSNCYATGNVSGSYRQVGGVVGFNLGSVSNCYATGTVVLTSGSGLGTDPVGGVVGDNLNSSIAIQNCAALNPSVTATVSTSNIGRVAGRNNDGTLTNNFGRNGMTVTANNVAKNPIINDGGDVDGATITATNWNSASWWQNTAGFPATSWEFRAGLPTLRNMPGGTQNPTVQ